MIKRQKTTIFTDAKENTSSLKSHDSDMTPVNQMANYYEITKSNGPYIQSEIIFPIGIW